MFSSCHRNRVALHALVVATDGLWPFGFTNSDIGQIDRLYDCEAYLPLPLARWAALTWRTMPGPTRHQPSDHTYLPGVNYVGGRVPNRRRTPTGITSQPPCVRTSSAADLCRSPALSPWRFVSVDVAELLM